MFYDGIFIGFVVKHFEKCVSIIITSSIDRWGPRNHLQAVNATGVAEDENQSITIHQKIIKKLDK